MNANRLSLFLVLLVNCTGNEGTARIVECAPPQPCICSCELERNTIAQMQVALNGQSKELAACFAKEQKYQTEETDLTACIKSYDTLKTSDDTYEEGIKKDLSDCQARESELNR